MTRRVLMLAFHFPPMLGSSGLQRTLNFCRHLPASGWEPIVLTVTSEAYPSTLPESVHEIPSDLRVVRSRALDVAQHLSIGGVYSTLMALPDRWNTWRLTAVRAGLRIVREHRPEAIWSTYPIATAHWIGSAIARKTGLPWVADFRDHMTDEYFPSGRIRRVVCRTLERRVIARSSRAVFVTPGALSMYADRYPAAADRMVCIRNGYDEESFAAAEQRVGTDARSGDSYAVILHSGLVSLEERDPYPLLGALTKLKFERGIDGRRLRVRFRASSLEGPLGARARQLDVDDMIELCGPVPYESALAEMLAVDALLVLQGPTCDRQIPAKVYEYLRTGRPIIGLVGPEGDTRQLLSEAGVAQAADIESEDEIARMLERFVTEREIQSALRPEPAAIRRYSRALQAVELADLLADVCSASSVPGADR